MEIISKSYLWLFNLRRILMEMNASMSKSVEETIMELFVRMTEKHSYYPEFSKNIHLYNGWKTNQAYKVGKKVILPCNGVFSSYSWDKDSMSEYTMISTISDIEKVLDYLAGERQRSWNTDKHLQIAAATGDSKNIPCKYFSVTFYKKGTMHIHFYDEAQPLLDRFNIFASQKNGWLPPVYGKVRYKDMGQEEQAVVDSFHGTDDTPGSGEAVYDKIMAEKGYYLTSPASTSALPLMLND